MILGPTSFLHEGMAIKQQSKEEDHLLSEAEEDDYW